MSTRYVCWESLLCCSCEKWFFVRFGGHHKDGFSFVLLIVVDSSRDSVVLRTSNH